MARKYSLIPIVLAMIALIGHHHPIMAYELVRFYIHGVPYIEQADPYWCGPASLFMVLGYWGCEMNQSEIAAHVYDPKSHLTSISNMMTFPRELGFNTTAIVPATIELLKAYIGKGIPLIVLQKLSYDNPYGHFRVVVGYNEKERMIITDDPLLGENYTLSYKAFSDLWQPGSTFMTVNWTLVIVPQPQSALMEQYNEMESRLETQSEELKNLKSLIIISLVAVCSLSLTNIYMVTKLRSLRIKKKSPSIKMKRREIP